MTAFRFQQFEVEHEHSSMKVGSDAVWLGALAFADFPRALQGPCLDIGAGCGVLSLMMAQRFGWAVEAIDIDDASTAEASLNFLHSPWSSRLQAIQADLHDWAPKRPAYYGAAICNPPFYEGSLMPPKAQRQRARHRESLSFEGLLEAAAQLLRDEAPLALILPASEWQALEIAVAATNWHPTRLVWLYTKPERRHRVVVELCRQKLPLIEEHRQIAELDLQKEFLLTYSCKPPVL